MLEETGERVDAQALTPERTWVRDAAPTPRRSPPTAAHPETSDLVAGWYMIDVESHQRALESRLCSSEPGPAGSRWTEWLDVREVMSQAPSND